MLLVFLGMADLSKPDEAEANDENNNSSTNKKTVRAEMELSEWYRWNFFSLSVGIRQIRCDHAAQKCDHAAQKCDGGCWATGSVTYSVAVLYMHAHYTPCGLGCHEAARG